MSDLHYLTATQLAKKLRSKELSCVELLELYLDRVLRHNPALNAIIVLDEEGARARAREADQALGRGVVWGP